MKTNRKFISAYVYFATVLYFVFSLVLLMMSGLWEKLSGDAMDWLGYSHYGMAVIFEIIIPIEIITSIYMCRAWWKMPRGKTLLATFLMPILWLIPFVSEFIQKNKPVLLMLLILSLVIGIYTLIINIKYANGFVKAQNAAAE